MKKLLLVILLTVLLASTLSTGLAAEPSEASGPYSKDTRVSAPTDAVLTVDEVMNSEVLGRRHIQRWERVIDDVVHVQNDYVRIHVDLDTNEIILYEKQWRDIKFESVDIKPFEPPDGEYIWKKVVLFVEEEDCGLLGDFFKGSPLEDSPLYAFLDAVRYPLVCWEVRYTDGTTVMYGLDGNRIGHAMIAAPSAKGYLASGTSEVWSHELAWKVARNSANFWYSRWTDSTTQVYDPYPWSDRISPYVRDPACKFYYAIGHGGSDKYEGEEDNGARYTYYTAGQVYADMQHRSPMRFALMVHCESMEATGPGTFSHEFRRGSMIGTVTVGFENLTEASTWANLMVFGWQNAMLLCMDAGYTIYDAYQIATWMFDSVAPYARFLGDTSTTVVDPSGVKGLVWNAETGWPLSGAKVEAHGTGHQVFTNAYGYYELPLPPGTYTLTASYVMFYDTTYTVQVFRNTFTEWHFVLEPMYPGMPIPLGVVPGGDLVE